MNTIKNEIIPAILLITLLVFIYFMGFWAGKELYPKKVAENEATRECEERAKQAARANCSEFYSIEHCLLKDK